MNPASSPSCAPTGTAAPRMKAPGTLTWVGTVTVTPSTEVMSWTDASQVPVPPPASASASSRESLAPGRTRPNETLVGAANTSGTSAPGRSIRPPPSRSGETSFPRLLSAETGLPVRTSADFTWAGVQVGWRCRSSATAPATCGAAMLVPSQAAQSPSRRGSDERICTPGAATSGFSWRLIGVGPPEEKSAIRSTPMPFPSPEAATEIALGAVAGESTEPSPIVGVVVPRRHRR